MAVNAWNLINFCWKPDFCQVFRSVIFTDLTDTYQAQEPRYTPDVSVNLEARPVLETEQVFYFVLGAESDLSSNRIRTDGV